MLDLHPFHEWLKMDGFSVDSVEPTTSSDGNTLIKIKAKYATAVPKMAFLGPVTSFTADVVLDPDNHWCIRKANYVYSRVKDTRVRDKGGAFRLPANVNIEYGPRIDGMLIPRVVTDVRVFPPESGLAGTVTFQYTISEVKKREQLAKTNSH